MKLLLAGLGNIGLGLLEHLVRMPDLESLVLVDPDRFTPSNVSGQAAAPGDAGRFKTVVAAERAHSVNPDLKVLTFPERLEEIPLGWYRGRTILSALDSRLARLRLSEIAVGLGAGLWIDMGVRPDGKLARATKVLSDGENAACFCCGWSERDYAAVSEEFSCAGIRAAPTLAPTYLGAAAGALGAQLLADGQNQECAREALLRHHYLSLESHKAWVTTVPRNPACRRPHQRWPIVQLDSLGELRGARACALPGKPFVMTLRCGCGATRPVTSVASRLPAVERRCACGQNMHYGPLDLAENVDLRASLPEAESIEAGLSALGIRDRDVVRLGDRHFELRFAASEEPTYV